MRRLLAVAVALLLAGCAAPPPPPPPGAPPRLVLVPAGWDDLPGWHGDRAAAVLPALLKSCARLARLPGNQWLGADGTGGTAADWAGPCAAARRLPPAAHAAARAFFRQWFSPWLATDNGKAEGLFTGYYQPELAGSRQRHGRFTVPLLARPRDLITVDLARLRPDLGSDQLAGRLVGNRLEPYPSRAKIEAGGLGPLAQPLLWLDDAVDAHILQIQGSGRVRLDDGSIVGVGVAATNGRKFIGLGTLLAERGRPDVGGSMPAIRAWLEAHPAEAGAVMAGNPRYVFYRLVAGDGPVGSEGVVLTPERTLAVDPRFVPLGVPLWLDTRAPSGQPIRRLVMAQDTGAAIKGPVRGDLFWGAGAAAFEQAGRMKSAGRLWLLLPLKHRPVVAAAAAGEGR